MMLLLLMACGVEGGLDQPNPPPAPPPVLVSAEPDVVRQTGLVSEVHGPTRSFVLSGEGKRVIVHLRDSGTLRLGGQPSLVQDLRPGTTLWVEGKRQGDLLVVLRASDAPEEDAAPSPGAAAPGSATEVAPADASAPSESTETPAAPQAAPSEPAGAGAPAP